MQRARILILTFTTVTLSLLWSAAASADAIRPPPKDCPAGSVGSSSHCGPECKPLACNSDDDCRDSKVCKETSLCIESGERGRCGKVPASQRTKKYPYKAAHGECPDKGDCEKGTCVPAKRCVTAPKAAPPPPKKETKAEPPEPEPTGATPPTEPSNPSGCRGCQVGDTQGSAWLLLLLLGLFLVGRRRLSTTITISAALPILLWAAPVLADAIPAEPTNCAPGSIGVSSHCGAECDPEPCKKDSDCLKKRVCRQTKLCIEKGERFACGRVPESEMQKKYPYQVAHGKCPDKGKCAQGTCVPAMRCVSPSDDEADEPEETEETEEPETASGTKTTPTKPSGCRGCQVGGTELAVWPLLLGLLLLVRGRRRT